MIKEEPGNAARKLIESQYFGVLATAASGQPCAYLMAFAGSDDLRYLMLAADINSQKYEDIARNRQVSFLIDNRSNAETDIKDGMTLTLFGMVTESEADIEHQMLKLYSDKYPSLVGFMMLSDTAFICIKVSKYIISGFDYSKEFKLG